MAAYDDFDQDDPYRKKVLRDLGPDDGFNPDGSGNLPLVRARSSGPGTGNLPTVARTPPGLGNLPRGPVYNPPNSGVPNNRGIALASAPSDDYRNAVSNRLDDDEYEPPTTQPEPRRDPYTNWNDERNWAMNEFSRHVQSKPFLYGKVGQKELDQAFKYYNAARENLPNRGDAFNETLDRMGWWTGKVTYNDPRSQGQGTGQGPTSQGPGGYDLEKFRNAWYGKGDFNDPEGWMKRNQNIVQGVTIRGGQHAYDPQGRYIADLIGNLNDPTQRKHAQFLDGIGSTGQPRGNTPKGMGGDDRPGFKIDTSCFVAGTLIDTPDGARCIETFVHGDAVYAVKDGRRIPATVMDTLKSTGRPIHLRIDNGATLDVTAEHPFFDPIAEKWVKAADLRVGSPLEAFEGDTSEPHVVTVEAISYVTFDPVQVYNLTVDGSHTYIANTIHVHNKVRIPPGHPLNPGGPGTTPPAANNFLNDVRQQIMARLAKMTQDPSMDDPALAKQSEVYRRSRERGAQDQRAAMAERAAANGTLMGGQSSGGFDTDLMGIQEGKAEDIAGNDARLMGEEWAARRAEVQSMHNMLLASGDTEAARGLQLQLARMDEALRLKQLAEQRRQADMDDRYRYKDLGERGRQHDDWYGRQLGRDYEDDQRHWSDWGYGS